ncbi:MAG: cytochrome c3 family protein [Nitrospirota bacterium]
MSARWYFGIVLGLFLLFPLALSAAPGTLSEEDRQCLACHEQEQAMVFQNGEKISIKVNSRDIGASVHRIIGCSNCHNFTADTHPKRSFKTKEQYHAFASRMCTRCHVSYKTEIHAKLISKAPAGTVCTDCHGAHTVRRTREMAQGNRYCLSCHGKDSLMSFKNGEKLSLHIKEERLNQSIHKDLSCSDCHFGFSSEDHPVRHFKNKRDYSIALSESCRRCHFDKYTKTLESIHFNLLAKGNLNAPVCTDCHGAHSVLSGRKEKLANAKKCEQCHPDIYQTYAKSVHGGALISEHNDDVPICSDCHKAHDISDPRSTDFRNMVPQMCGKCHANKDIMEKYGLSTAVVDTYLQDFHGITLKFYKKMGSSKPIAVCIDCHGIHDITKTHTPNTNLIKANLVKRCQKCHQDASIEFPESWISHYDPSIKKAPMVYMVNLAYKIFIPFMIIGLILQILLHIWRYAINK